MSVLSDIDLDLRDDGVLVTTRAEPGLPPEPDPGDGPAVPLPPDGSEQVLVSSDQVLVSWEELAEALGDHDPLSAAGRYRVGTLLQLYRLVAEHGRQLRAPAEAAAPERIRLSARALALPPGHALHPGADWVLGQVRGGVLDLGIGVLGLASEREDVRPLPPSLARRLDLRADRWWPDLSDHVERMGRLAAQRITRDGRPTLRPVGGCDALTLLASGPLRTELARADGTGLRTLALPARRRGWFDLSQIDPAYIAAVWSIISEPDRGLPSPVLVTRDEVVLPPPGGDVIATSLGTDG